MVGTGIWISAGLSPPLFPLSRFPRSPLPSRAIWRNDPFAMVKPWEEKVGGNLLQDGSPESLPKIIGFRYDNILTILNLPLKNK